MAGRIAWWIPLLLMAGMVPVLVVRVRTGQASWGVCERNTGMFNAIRLLDRILTQPAFAKDLRMFHMQAPLLATWRERYGRFLREARRVRMRGAWRLLLASTFAGACLFPAFIFVINGFSAGRASNDITGGPVTAGTLVVFFGCLVQISQGLSTLIFHWG
ncbi:hypothetical protein [Robbsia sp. KACC 23696]|uniref:hypothetical protein n=1 Tax=Robbsia sp. KACC 23696 TaxID=3149231 RepID=UPI00325BBFEC